MSLSCSELSNVDVGVVTGGAEKEALEVVPGVAQDGINANGRHW